MVAEIVRLRFVPYCRDVLTTSEIDRVFSTHNFGLPEGKPVDTKTKRLDAYLSGIDWTDAESCERFSRLLNSTIQLADDKEQHTAATDGFLTVCRDSGYTVANRRLVNGTTLGVSRPHSVRWSILFQSANPPDENDGTQLRTDVEYRVLQEAIQRATQRDNVKLNYYPMIGIADLHRSLLDVNANVVHFAGHGAGTAGIAIESSVGAWDCIPIDALTDLFRTFTSKIECVLFNACDTAEQASALAAHVKYVIGMTCTVHDNTAIQFARGFYDALGAGRSVPESFRHGQAALKLYQNPEHFVPALWVDGSRV